MSELPKRNEVVRIPGRGPVGTAAEQRLALEVAGQLRKRLILINVVVLMGNVLFCLGRALNLLADTGLGTFELLYFGLLAALVSPLVVLVSRPALTLRSLRLLEVVFFGVTALALAGWQWRAARGEWFRGLAVPGHDTRLLGLIGDNLCFPWFALITFYGTCIPNSGRRCAAVVAALAATALLTVALIAWADPDLGPGLLRTTLTKTAIWLTVGAATAVYGAERLQIMRREALTARELGQYVLKERLGGGGMGEVFLAEHRLLRRDCALKLIRPDRAGDDLTLQRFQREVKAMASLTHPNSVQVFDYGVTDDGVFYYVMERLRGMNLQQLVDSHGPLPPARAVHLLRQACGALHEAHARGLLHRDVKPSNIFVGECGLVYDTVKLLDFGLVRQVGAALESSSPPPAEDEGKLSQSSRTTWSGQLTESGCLSGTPLYLSPEQVAGATLDARSDIYSLGLAAYFVLSGQHPFRRETRDQIIAARLHDPVPPLLEASPTVDVDLNGVVMRCLERDPDGRFADVDQLDNALACCSCSGRWNSAAAAAWWRLHVPDSTR